MLDPGIGFGKTVEHNLELLRRLGELAELGRPVVIGTSRSRSSARSPGARSTTASLTTSRHERARLPARCKRVPGSRRCAGPRRTHRHCCYGQRAMDRPPDEFDDVDDVDDDGEEHPEPEVTIEISGLSLYTHVGVTAAEREVGQRPLLDLRIDVGECDATVTDRIEDTVDYGQVCDPANLVAHQRTYKTLERLCSAIADRLIEQLRGERGVGQGRQARAADGAAGQRGVGRGVARGRVGRPAAAAILGLGSNVGDRRAHLEAAVGRCLRHGVDVVASSSVY